jgi:ABC-type branched-subunit amino acid transport system substrate-binding protein
VPGFGEQMQRGAALAVADINAVGGVLGQQVQLTTADELLRSRAGGRRREKAGQ